MSKYQIKFYWSDGEVEVDDNDGDFYNSEAEATEAGDYGLSCYREGGETLEMSNPGDYPFDESDCDDAYFEVEKVQ